jgi:hypothetical protein
MEVELMITDPNYRLALNRDRRRKRSLAKNAEYLDSLPTISSEAYAHLVACSERGEPPEFVSEELNRIRDLVRAAREKYLAEKGWPFIGEDVA